MRVSGAQKEGNAQWTQFFLHLVSPRPTPAMWPCSWLLTYGDSDKKKLRTHHKPGWQGSGHLLLKPQRKVLEGALIFPTLVRAGICM